MMPQEGAVEYRLLGKTGLRVSAPGYGASPPGMGLPGGGGPPDWNPAPAALKEACARAADRCRARGADFAQLAIRYSLANAEVATVVVGTASPADVERNVRWLEVPLDLGLLAEVQAILEPVRDINWPSGRPENN